MFKVGDVVVCIDTGGFSKLIKGNHYEVEKNEGYVELKEIPGFGWNKTGFKLAASQVVQPTLPSIRASGSNPTSTQLYKFKKGDVVRCIKAKFKNETVGKTYIVNSDYDGGQWFWVQKDDNGNQNSYHPEDFELVSALPGPYAPIDPAPNVTDKLDSYLYEMKKNKSDCECGNGHNRVGQGHSSWCRMFRQEF